MREKILVVEDDPLMLGALEILLSDEGYEVITASSGLEAIERARETQVDLVVCDVRMAEMDGIETLSHLKAQHPHTRSIVITGYASPDAPIQAIKLGVDDYLMKPFDDRQFVQSVRRSLEAYRLQRRFAEGLRQQWRDFSEVVRLLAEAREEGDPHFAGHSRRVAALAGRTARAMGLSRDRQEILELAAYLHDIGTIGQKQELLNRTEELMADERTQVQEATTQQSETFFSSLSSLREVFKVILHHHEWFDGSGYPHGLKGSEIPIESRILCVCEAYDALISPRPHRESLSHADARQVLEREAGTHFDPEVVRVVLERTREIAVPQGREEEEEALEEELSRERKVQTMLGLAGTYLAGGDLEVAGRAFSEALELVGTEGPGSERSEALVGLALCHLHREQLSQARKRAEEGVAAAVGGRQLLEARATAVRGLVRGVQGELEGALEDLAAANAVFTLWEAHIEKARTLLYQAWVLRQRSHEEAGPLVIQAAELIDRYGLQEVLKQERHVAVPLLLEAAAARDGEAEALARLLQWLGWEAVSPFLASVDTRVREEAMKLLSPRDGAVAQVPPLSLYTFGKFRVFGGGQEVEDKLWKTRKSKYLFAYLALHAGRDVPDEKLMDLFWPDHPPEKSRQSLYAALSHMRKALEAVVPGETDRVVLARKGFYRFNDDRPFFLDVAEFERQVEVGQTRQREGRYEEAVAAYQKAEALYEGEFLEGYYGDWALYVRDEMEREYLEVLERLMNYFFNKKRFEVAADYAQRLLRQDPCHQDAHLQMMRIYLEQGKPEQAARQYHHCSKVMKDELNISPSPEITELFLAIKA